MKRISHSKVNFILLIFITIWVSIILIAQAIPDLKLILRVTNRMIKEISYGNFILNSFAFDNILSSFQFIYFDTDKYSSKVSLIINSSINFLAPLICTHNPAYDIYWDCP